MRYICIVLNFEYKKRVAKPFKVNRIYMFENRSQLYKPHHKLYLILVLDCHLYRIVTPMLYTLGNTTLKVEPFSISLETLIDPLCSLTMVFAIDKPSPEPPLFPERDLSNL